MNTTTQYPIPTELATEVVRAWSTVPVPIDVAEVPHLIRALLTAILKAATSLSPALHLGIVMHSIEALAARIEAEVAARAEAEAEAYAIGAGNEEAGLPLLRLRQVELPAPDSVWYLFQNPDLRVRVVASNADAVFYTDVRTEGLNREARRSLPKEAFETKTQPLFHFLAAATPEVSNAH